MSEEEVLEEIIEAMELVATAIDTGNSDSVREYIHNLRQKLLER